MTATAAKEIQAWIDGRPRENIIHPHGVTVSLAFWEAIEGLPGAPLTGGPSRLGKVHIDRGQIFTMADAAVTDSTGTAALKMLWHALAWGSDQRNYNNPGRIASIAKDPVAAGQLLHKAAKASRVDPEKAFMLLHPKPGKNAISSLGPNFSTKFLYFAGAGRVDHPCLIVDKRVMAELHRRTEDSVFLPPGTNYGFFRYEAALAQMTAWAREASTAERMVAPDEVEMWAFRQ